MNNRFMSKFMLSASALCMIEAATGDVASNQTSTPTNTTTPATTPATTAEVEATPAEAFAKRFEDRGKVVARVTDDQTAFGEFINATFNEANPYKDWASENAPKLGDGVTLAMVLCEESGDNRLIAIAGKDMMFGTGGDEVVKETAYKMIVNKALTIAQKADSTADMFATVGGFLKAKFDLSAFKDYAREVVKVLHDKGLRGITVPTLRIALGNAAFAKAQFPAMQEDQWKIIFSIFQQNAEAAGQDTSILAHWLKTRDAMSATGVDLEGFTLESFAAAMADEDEGDASAS